MEAQLIMLTIENVNQDIETTLKRDKSDGVMPPLPFKPYCSDTSGGIDKDSHYHMQRQSKNWTIDIILAIPFPS